MKQGKYCKPHNQWVPEGDCPWCEPPPPALVVVSPFAAAYQRQQDSMKEALAQRLFAQAREKLREMKEAATETYLGIPLSSCKHDGVLLDYAGTTSCSACGKVLSVVNLP